MSCANKASFPLIAIPAPTRAWKDRSPLVKAIVAVFESFHEALDMRRAAHSRRPFIDE